MDTDADGIEDPADNCPTAPNAVYGGTCVAGLVGAPCMDSGACWDGENTGVCSLDQEDLDSDGTGDACDPDQDGDGVEAAAGDCEDRNALIFPGAEEVCDYQDNDCDGNIDNAPTPPPIATLSFAPDKDAFYWTAVDGATGYDAVAGDLIALAELGIEATVAHCIAENTESTEANDPFPLWEGEGRWYLVRGVNCGGAGSYGSGNPPRSPSRDEAIALSGNDCDALP